MTQALAETEWGSDLLPTPTTSDTNGAGGHGAGGADLRTAVAHDLMPTPRAGDGEKGGPNQRGSSGDLMLPSAVTMLPTPTSRDWKDGPPCENVPDDSLLGRVVHNLLPTPTTTQRGADSNQLPEGGHETRSGTRSGERLLPGVAKYELLPTTTTEPATGNGHARNLAAEIKPSRWGKYAAAIARWEAITRPAPEPTNVTDGYLKMRAKRLLGKHPKPVGMRGSLKPRRQLAARFSEWMMGVPLGWITDVPGITRNEALKAAGNGVVPQQAAEALRFLLDMPTGRDIAAAHEPGDLLELLGASS